MAPSFSRYADEESMRQWVEENPGLVNSRSGVEEAPLYKVIQCDFLMLVTWLLEEKGADVNLRGLCAHTPLCVATSPEMVTVLLTHGASVTKPSVYYGGHTPSHVAHSL